MEENMKYYLQKRPYRKGNSQLSEYQFLLKWMEKRFSESTHSDWKSFGYEIGGPVCYGYTKWLIEEIERNYPEITDLAFVARDGWLLQKIFALIPHRAGLESHYIYAPRTMNLLCQNKERHEEYKNYLSKQDWGNGTIAVVDTVTMKFSSQRLIASSISQKTHGFFWVVLDSSKNYGEGFDFSTYQKERYHTIRYWNLMEFIMTSPEAPIRSMDGDKPIYRSTTSYEAMRREIFEQIEAGVLEFVLDICQTGTFPLLSNELVTKWVNDFLRNPNQEDRVLFDGVMFSEQEDHSDSIPLNPFGEKSVSWKVLKDRLWLYSQRHKLLYQILHTGNIAWKKAKVRIQGSKYLKYDGKQPEKMAELCSRYDVVSFDIFDTLILRKVKKPTDLFYEMEKKNGLFDFHDVRIQSEADARRNSGKKNGEVDIFDIYQELSRHYEIEVEKQIAEELEAEKAVCYANPKMKTLYQLLIEKGIKMIAVSDMYLPASYLRELLDDCGYTEIKQIFVSCDCGVGKGNGGLQKLVQSKLGSNLRYIHIGDNFQSDVLGSKMSDWNAAWYQK